MNLSQKLKGHVQKVTEGILVTPKRVVTADISAAGVEVKDGSILRVRVTATTYLAFGKGSTMGAVGSGTSNAIELSAGTHLIAISDPYVRASSNPARVELLV